ncbi:TMhelix containing protein [Vibrio phage 1.284.A._10N.286.55.A5]|nr:TMhelix containing protein [Vibrio phage 1.284.A._10N.286.55.A5]
MKSTVFGIAVGVCSGLMILLASESFYNRPIEQTKTFKVECKSFDFDGEVFRDGKKFYELIGGKEIWIPLGDCLLREVE